MRGETQCRIKGWVRFRKVMALILLICLCGGCEDPPNPKHVGIIPQGPHGATIQFLRCRGEYVKLVRLDVVRSDDPHKDKTIWEVAAKRQSKATYFPIGTSPAGFTETVHLSARIPNTYLAAYVETNMRMVGAIVFRLFDLRRGRVWVDVGLKTIGDFRKDASGDCR
jgi:hypothetical protein